MKYSFFKKRYNLLFLALITFSLLVACDSKSKKSGSGQNSGENTETVFLLNLTSPIPSNSKTSNGAHGTCAISEDFQYIVYTKLEINYTGNDNCTLMHSDCMYDLAIDFGESNPYLYFTGSVACR